MLCRRVDALARHEALASRPLPRGTAHLAVTADSSARSARSFMHSFVHSFVHSFIRRFRNVNGAGAAHAPDSTCGESR